MAGDAKRRAPQGPIVIGGSGGSGTRALAEFLYRNGVDMPNERNSAFDCVQFTEFLRRWMDPILAVTGRLDYRFEELPDDLRRAIADDLAATLASMRASLRRQNRSRWGWKCPRNVVVLPVLAALVPDVVFVHLVRDGRDMLLSENQNQARRFTAVLTDGLYHRDPRRAAAETWAKVNREVATAGEALLGARYLRVRYEDLCAPSPAARKALLQRLKLRRRTLDGVFEPSDGMGRWRSLAAWRVRSLHRVLAPELVRFGYLSADEAAALAESPLLRLRRRLAALLPGRKRRRRRRAFRQEPAIRPASETRPRTGA